MDTWESFFREKSWRRSVSSRMRSVAGWSLAAFAFLLFVVALLKLIGV